MTIWQAPRGEDAVLSLFLLLPALLATYVLSWIGPARWVVAIIFVTLAIYSFAKPDRQLLRFLGLSPTGKVKAFALIAVATAIFAFSLTDTEKAAAEEIAALPMNDPQRASLLANASWSILARVRSISPALATEELARRSVAKDDKEHARGQEAISTMWHDLTEASKSCESWVSSLESHLKSGRVSLEAYQTAKQGSNICFDTRGAINMIKPPDVFPKEDRELLGEGLQKCAEASLDRMMFMEKASEVLDGSRSFETLSLAQTAGQAAGLATAECYLKISSAAKRYNLELK